MKFITISLLVALCLIMAPAPGIAQRTLKRIEKLRKVIANTRLARMPGGVRKIAASIREYRGDATCDPNICFAIDGTASLGKDDFNLQKEFVAIVSAIIGADPRAKFAAVQYGSSSKVIRNLRGNTLNFLRLLEAAEFARARRTFVGVGVAYCVQQLSRRRGDASMIVVLADGRSSHRASGPFNPVAIADRWRAQSPANSVSAVAVGFSDVSLLEDIADSPDLVHEVPDWERVLNSICELVRDICAIQPAK